MNTKLSSHLAVALLAAGAAIASPASAQLKIDVSGTTGTNKTLWKFSGTSTYSANNLVGGNDYVLDDDDNPGDSWIGLDWLVGVVSPNDQYFNAGNTASITVGSRTELIQVVELDDRGPGSDQFGLGTNSITNPIWLYHGDVVSWTGSGELNIDISALNSGTFNFSNFNNNGTLNMTMNVSSSSAVPEPGEWAAMGILGAGLAGLVIRKRRQA